MFSSLKPKNKTTVLFIMAASILLLSVTLLFNRNLWFDEAYTFSMIQHSFKDMIRITSYDVHPPLYYCALKLFCMFFGYTVQITKLFSALGLLGSLMLGVFPIRKRLGYRIAAIYLLVMAAIPFSFYFSVQPRSYSWSTFCVTACAILAYDLATKHKTFIQKTLFVVVGAIGFYLHIYTMITILCIYLALGIYFAVKKRDKLIGWTVMAGSAAILYLPWLFVLLKQVSAVSQDFWIKQLDPLVIILCVLTPVLFLCMLKMKELRTPAVYAAMGILVLTQFIGVAASLLIRPLLLSRYLVPCAGLFSFIITQWMTAVKRSWRRLFLCLFIAMIVTNYGFAYHSEYNHSQHDFDAKIGQVLTQDDIFLYNDEKPFGVMASYYPQNTHLYAGYKPLHEAFSPCGKPLDVSKVTDYSGFPLWYVGIQTKPLPAWIAENYRPVQFASFCVDYDHFIVYRLNAQ